MNSTSPVNEVGDSPTSQQSDHSSHASYSWIDQMAEIDPMELWDQSAEHFYRKWLKEGGVENIDDAVMYCEMYIERLPESHPDRANMESRLVACLTEQYLAADEEKAEGILRSAIVLTKKLYDSTSKDDVALCKRANNYAILLGHRYNSSQREIDDLDKSIRLAEEAVATSPQAGAILHQEQGTIEEEPGDAVHILNTLCSRLEARFLIMGSLADLNRAINIWTKLVDTVSHEESQGARPTWLSNLSSGLLRRYEQSEKGDPEDLRRSIDLSREALEYIDDKDPRRAEVLCMLAHPLAQRAIEADDTKAMDAAINLLWQAHEISPKSHEIEIGFSLGLRLFQASKMMSNSEENRDTFNKTAVLIATSSLEFTPENHPIKPHLHNLIGLCHFYDRPPGSPSERDSTAQTALEHLEKALDSPNYVPVYFRVQAGRLILRLCCKRGEWKKAYEASVKAIDLIPKITSRSIRNADKQRLLSLDDVVGFSADAAAAALNAGDDGYAALNLLEKGRGLLAASVAELRVDLVELHHQHKRLAERFVALRDQLQMSSQQQHQANLDFDALLNEIREKPGFENFLGPLRREDIHEAAQDGPVVVLSASEFRGIDAILITLDDMRVLRLEEATMKQLEAHSQDLASLDSLEWLWDAIVKPIMGVLGFTQPPLAGNSFSRIWWIPTGILSKFPFHAAGHHSIPTSTDTVMDRVMSSYSSSIKALLRVRDHSYHPISPKESEALLVTMTQTLGRFSDLPHAYKEIQEVEQLLKDKSCKSITLYNQPRKEKILQDLETYQIFHFAGHSIEDPFDPLRSVLLLLDWQTDPMTVDSMLDLNLSEKNCFLVYLSACETGQVTQAKFRDESIHLVSAYQLAGFRHVIGTLWSVEDFPICRGLHTAAMKLRNESRINMIKQAARREKARDRASARKGLAADSSEDEGDYVDSAEQFWIPYVHFGV
ncbi:hypothetical protein B7463_g11602, partial [Scytalidium lignicola]